MRLNHRKLEELIMKKSLKESSQIEKLVLMEVKLLNEEVTYLEFLHEEGNRLKAMGHSKEEVNEQISDMFSGLLDRGLDGAIDSIKALILNALLKSIGLDPAKPDGWGLLGCAISNTLEELDVATFKKIFGGATSGYSAEGLKGVWPNICGDLTDLILRGVTECAAHKAQRSKLVLGFYSAIVGDVSSAEAQKNFLWNASDETLQNVINDTELMVKMREFVSAELCAIDVTEMFGKAGDMLGGVASKLLGGLGLGGLFGGGEEGA